MSVSKNSGPVHPYSGGMPFFEYHGVEPGAYYAGVPYPGGGGGNRQV